MPGAVGGIECGGREDGAFVPSGATNEPGNHRIDIGSVWRAGKSESGIRAEAGEAIDADGRNHRAVLQGVFTILKRPSDF